MRPATTADCPTDRSRDDASVTTTPAGDGKTVIQVDGRLDGCTLASVWPAVLRAAGEPRGGDVVLDVSRVSYCDGAGLGLFVAVRRAAAARAGGGVTFRGAPADLRRLVERSATADPLVPELVPVRPLPFVSEVGKATWGLLAELYAMVAFLGQLLAALAGSLARPRRVRWRDLFFVAEKAGVDAAPVVCLLGLLIGVILAFQCAIPMRRYGAEEVIPAVVSIALTRELGPLIAAVLFAGRSGSGFTAEIGTMTITEEVAALRCMGLDPVRFLVVPRVLAAMAMLPLLATLCELTGILGGYSIMADHGFSFVRYVHAVRGAVSYVDLLGGLAKTVAFGAIVAGVGCHRGLRTAGGPGAVGDSTTSSVVQGIVLVIVADALFGVMYYYLGI